MRRIEFTRPFRDDTHRQVDLLVRSGEVARIVALAQELVLLQERLSEFPALGRELLADERRSLRRIALGRVPYFVWYRYDRVGDLVRFTRLFHAHQHTPRPRLP